MAFLVVKQCICEMYMRNKFRQCICEKIPIYIRFVDRSIGLVSAVLSPFFLLIAHWLKLERFELPSITAFNWMLGNGFFGTVLPNYLWGLVVVLLNPLIATVGANMQIPLVMLADRGLSKKYDCM